MHQWIFLCPLLSEAGGHEADYVRKLSETARHQGVNIRLLLPQNTGVQFSDIPAEASLLPVWSRKPTKAVPLRVLNKLLDVFHSTSRERQYRRIFSAGQDCCWLLHTAPLPEIGLILNAFRRASADSLGHRLKIIIRADHHDDPLRIAQFRSTLNRAGPGVDLYADTPELADMLMELSAAPIQVVPIPGLEPAAPVLTKRPWSFGYFGLRRRSKGFHRLPDIVATLPENHKFQAIVHSTAEVDAVEDHKDVEMALRAQGVSLRYEHLSAYEYRNRLLETEILLLPYDSREYRYGSSGVFIDALKAGCSVVVPRGTSMAAEAIRDQLSQVYIIDFSSAAEIIAAVSAALAERGQMQHLDERWLERHSPAGVWNALSYDAPYKISKRRPMSHCF